MKRMALFFMVVATAGAVQATPGRAQTDLTVPGGATGADVFCVQAGDLSSGAFVGTFLQTDSGGWEERSESDTFKLEEKKRDALMVELLDPSRSTSFQLDFVAKTIRDKSSSSGDTWTDRNVILNATDKATSGDCVAYATRSKASDTSTADPGPGTTVRFVTIAPQTKFIIDPGTELTATTGPPCPGFPGFFVCPNKFNCAPAGGVCCPGAGTCDYGKFCDLWVKNRCIVAANPRVCPGSGNLKTGMSLHCAPGERCLPGDICR